MKETIEHNNRFYGEELKTESEQLKEWLIVANKHNEELQKERDMYKGSFEEMSKNYFESQKEIERLNNKEAQLIRRLEDLIIVGEQVENEWAVDICKMIIEELKGSDKE